MRTMTEQSPTSISQETADKEFGISVDHERMPGGELRFRLVSDDGSSYIRTVTSETGGWQKSHYHRNIQETYVVQRGWMILARMDARALRFVKLEANDSVTSLPMTPHNVYLPSDSVIHTIKHGGTPQGDRISDPNLDALTLNLSEKQALVLAESTDATGETDGRFASYVAVYNNLDNIIWKMPAFFAAAIGVLLALLANIISREKASMPSELWALALFFIALLLALGTYSLIRLRQHHTIMGKHLQKMEGSGYFHQRQQTLGNIKLPAAPVVFIFVFAVLSVLFLGVAVAAYFEICFVTSILGPKIS
jgi:mannose-6-phosphate isomerase-like protein (cupin superfamily)